MEVGTNYEFSYTVKDTDLAQEITEDPKDEFPAVLATSRMVALMELAAARIMQPLLSDGELSVGVGVNITHMAATANNETVRVVAEFKGMLGKLYKFDVSLFDSAGLAGQGRHTRAIVERERIVETARERAGKDDS